MTPETVVIPQEAVIDIALRTETLRLAKIEQATHMLMEAQTLPEVQQIRDMAEALRQYARQRNESLDTQNAAAELKLRAERRGGELLREMPKAKGGNPNLLHDATGLAIAYADIGLERTQAMRWQQIAWLIEEMFEAHIETTKARRQELTSAGMLRLARAYRQELEQQQRRDTTVASLQREAGGFVTDIEALVGTQTYGCIYVDPPWQYSNQATRASTNNHYATMTIDEICALPVRELAGASSHLHLWTTNAFLFECPKIFDAWGFEFKSSFVWVKPHMGIGNYWRNSHELLLLGIRGGLRAQVHNLKSWIEAPREGHSAKPERIRAMLEVFSPGPFLELFGRHSVPGWTVWGNECVPANGQLFRGDWRW